MKISLINHWSFPLPESSHCSKPPQLSKALFISEANSGTLTPLHNTWKHQPLLQRHRARDVEKHGSGVMRAEVCGQGPYCVHSEHLSLRSLLSNLMLKVAMNLRNEQSVLFCFCVWDMWGSLTHRMQGLGNSCPGLNEVLATWVKYADSRAYQVCGSVH